MTMKDLRTLLAALDPEADLAARHIWLIALFDWLRGDESSVDGTLARLQTFIDAVHAQPELEARLKAWWQVLFKTVDVTTLLADFGFAPRTAFVSELAERLRRKILPGTPQTLDAAELFALAASTRFDAQWLAAIPDAQMDQLAALLSSQLETDTLPLSIRKRSSGAKPVARICAVQYVSASISWCCQINVSVSSWLESKAAS